MVSLSTIVVGEQPQFRIDTDIYFGDSKQPSKQTLTLFSEGVYYDFSIDEPTLVTMIDPARNRIVLLDEKRHIKTIIDTMELKKLVEAAREQAASNGLALLLQAADRVSFDEAAGKLSVGLDEMSYQATLQEPKDPLMAKQYADFADWSARLNAVYPPQLPPYVRMRLNQELGERGFLPNEIVRSTRSSNSKGVEIRSRLIANWRLSSDDQAKIKKVGEHLAQFNELENSKYFAQQKQR